jgi:hypothetical protein
MRQELTFFHHFCALRQPWIDDHLVEEVSRLRTVWTNPLLWQEVSVTVPAKPLAEKAPDGNPGPRGNKQAKPKTNAPKPEVQIGLVSHANLEIHTDLVDLCIALRCQKLLAVIPTLYLCRSSGDEEVARAVQVCHVSDQFIVRLKLPLSQAKYELIFRVTPTSAPGSSIPHSLRYVIFTSDACPNLLPNLQHPLAHKFGYAPMLPTAQEQRISVISPVSYRICLGQQGILRQTTYFLLHVAGLVAASTCEKEHGTHGRYMPEPLVAGPSTTLFSSRLKRCGERGNTTNWAADLHQSLQKFLQESCQDSIGEVHLDASIGGRYVTRLKQRNDFPELFEGMMHFGEQDCGSRVEIFLRRPKQKAEEYAPQKIGEWLICLGECFPVGF